MSFSFCRFVILSHSPKSSNHHLTFVSIRPIQTMAAVGAGVTNTPHMSFTGLSGVVCWTRAGKVVEGDGAFSSVLTRLRLQGKQRG